MPLPSQPPTAYLSADNPADNGGFLSDMSTIGLAITALVLLIAVALLVWQTWSARRDQLGQTAAAPDVQQSPGQDTEH